MTDMDMNGLGDGRITINWTGVEGRAGLVPQLVLRGTIVSRGYGFGATAQISAQATADWQAPVGNSFMGSFAPVVTLLRWPPQQFARADPPPEDEKTTQVELLLPMPLGSVETLEQARQGHGFEIRLHTTVVLIDGGKPNGPREDAHYKSLSVRDDQDVLKVSRNDWEAVLERWERGTGFTVFVPVNLAEADPDRAEVATHLRTARSKIDGGDYTGSFLSSRLAVELLRKLLSQMPQITSTADPKDHKERNAMQRVRAVAQALFDYASTPIHTGTANKDFTPDRADAVAAAAGAASLAQLVFARLNE